MVWARNDLAAGTELTFSYVDPDRSHASRAASLQTVWNFKCDCGSCLDDREEDDAERDRLMTVEWPKVVAATAGKSDVVIGASQKALLPAFFDGEMGDTYRLAGQDVQMPEISGWKEANAMYRLFCEKLEKTYRQDRTAPKTALATVYTETQDCFDTNYPRGTRSAVDVRDIAPALLTSGIPCSPPDPRRCVLHTCRTTQDGSQDLGPTCEWHRRLDRETNDENFDDCQRRWQGE
jgi:hypothetical protein